jgi:hypothetical protein
MLLYRDILIDMEGTVLSLLRRLGYYQGATGASSVVDDINVTKSEARNISDTNRGASSSTNDINVTTRGATNTCDISNTTRHTGIKSGEPLTILLRNDRLSKDKFVSDHTHSVEQCCAMTESQVSGSGINLIS